MPGRVTMMLVPYDLVRFIPTSQVTGIVRATKSHDIVVNCANKVHLLTA